MTHRAQSGCSSVHIPIHITDNSQGSTKFSRSQAQVHPTTIMVVTIVLDNGASTIKVGIVNKDEQPRSELGTRYQPFFDTSHLVKTGSFPMLSLGQREIKQHTLAMKWHNAKIIRLFIIVYLLRRLTSHTILMQNHQIPLSICQGFLVDWDAEKAVWDGIFSDQVLRVSFALSLHWHSILFFFWVLHQVETTQACLLITEPYFNLPNLQEVYDQLVFEEYEFSSYHRCTRK